MRVLLRVGAMGLCTILLATSLQAQEQRLDAAFPKAMHPTYGPVGPRILHDDSHRNLFSSTTRGKGLADLYRADGALVAPSTGTFTSEVLASYDGVILSTAAAAPDAGPDAYSPDEIEALAEWVQGGRGLLIVADHFPTDQAMASLLRRFGIRMGEGVVADSIHYDRSHHNTWLLQNRLLEATFWTLFTYDNGLLGDHFVTKGLTPADEVSSVLIFGGTSFSVPSGATSFLNLSSSARAEHVPGRDEVHTPTLERSQGLLFQFGNGRIVVLGDASMTGAQQRSVGARWHPFGLNRPDVDNVQLALNILHWLVPPRP